MMTTIVQLSNRWIFDYSLKFTSLCVTVQRRISNATTALHAISNHSNRMKIVEYLSVSYPRIFYLSYNACSMNNNEKRFTNRIGTMATYVRTIHLEIRAVVGRALCEISPDG